MNEQMKSYRITKETCYWIRRTSTNIRKRIEVIREIIHNAVDAEAKGIKISCDYDKDLGLIIKFAYKGKPFLDEKEILDALMKIGKSSKEGVEREYIGGMGIGLKGILDCKNLKVVSINKNIKTIVEIKNPLKQIKKVEKGEQKGVYYISNNKKIDDESNEIEINVVGLNHQKLVDFSSTRLKQYIEFFTVVGSDKYISDIEVKLTGLKFYSEKEEGFFKNIVPDKKEYTIKSGCIDQKINVIKNIQSYDNEYQIFSSKGEGFDGYEAEYAVVKKLCEIEGADNKIRHIDFLVLTSINKEIKKIINPNVYEKGLGRELESKFFGFYMAKSHILVPELISFTTLKEGGNASVQYFGVFNYDELVLKSDRNGQGGDLDSEKVAQNVQKIAEILSKIKVLRNKEFKKEQLNLLTEEKIIKNEILTEIKKAKICIWIAMAWFSDKEIYTELKKKANEGVDIRLIVSDEASNTLDYEIFNTERVHKFGFNEQNRMHCKFVIFDLKVALNGSYNWSKNAERNTEAISRVTSKKEVEKLARKFNEIVLGNKKDRQMKLI
ncbi:MAG: phospholipase D-like domain-containing protein [Clostridium sp.]